MTVADKSKIYSIIGAVLFTLLGCYNIYFHIDYIHLLDLNFDDIIYIFLDCAVLVGFGAMLFLRNKKGVLVVSAVKAALILYMLFLFLDIYYGFYFVVYGGLVYLSVLFIQRNNIVKKIWFIPMAVLCVMDLWMFITYHSVSFVYLAEVAGVLFIGLWIREDAISLIDKKEPKVNNVNGVFSQHNTGGGSNPDLLIGGADRLKACKELLDSGVITQEEFEVKKKQILEKY